MIVPAEVPDLPLIRALLDKCPQKGCFPRPIQPDQSGDLAARKFGVDSSQDRPAAEGHAEVSDRRQTVAHRSTRASSVRFLCITLSYRFGLNSPSSHVSSGSTSANSASIGLSLSPRRASRTTRADELFGNCGSTAITRTGLFGF